MMHPNNCCKNKWWV